MTPVAQAERVLVDYAKYKLRIIVTEKKEWREKTMKQVPKKIK